jgi:hypothetical protein
MAEILFENMVLSKKEKAIAMISNAIAAYSIYAEKESLTEGQSLIDFILKGIPDDMKEEVSIELIDEVFGYISKSRLDS